MAGDYSYGRTHGIQRLPNGMGRKVILSAAIQPDFELSGNSEVVMKIVEVKTLPIEGKIQLEDPRPLWEQVERNREAFEDSLERYEHSLQAYMVHQLTQGHRLPALSEVEEVLEPAAALERLEQLIDARDEADLNMALMNQFVRLNEHVISLEALFNLYVHQVRNEFSILEQNLTQGYVYTLDPPAIFARQIGTNHVNILNRLQILALKHIQKQIPLKNLKVIGFNDYADKEAVQWLRSIFREKEVCPKSNLFQAEGRYSVPRDYALVLHNNSDAFGQNIQTEGPTSMDGVIGFYSDASIHLRRERPNLTANRVRQL